MSSKRPLPFGEAFEKLAAQHGKGKGKSPKYGPGPYLRPSTIKVWPEVFQHRLIAEYQSTAHVRELAKHAHQPQGLQAITVWWDGKAWACIDGHHRIKAYRAAGMSERPVPVVMFEGSPAEAVAAAARANTQDKLSMSRTEKTNAAWRLVLVGGLAKTATAAASGASERTVANMRRVRDALMCRGVDCGPLGWEAARRLERGQDDASDEDREDLDEKLAQEMATSVTKAIGRRGSEQVHAFARALELYDPRMPSMLLDYWGANGDE